MIKILIAFTLISSTAIATDSSFTQTAEWSSKKAFNVLQAEGVKMDSIDKALDKCQERRRNQCVIKNTMIVKHNSERYSSRHGEKRKFTEIRANIHAINSLYVERRTEIFEEEKTWTFDKKSTKLKRLGVKGSALDKALNSCYSSGYDFCIIQSVSLPVIDRKFYDSDQAKDRYKTTGRAAVEGYRVEQI